VTINPTDKFINCRAERIVAKIIPSNYQELAKRLAWDVIGSRNVTGTFYAVTAP